MEELYIEAYQGSTNSFLVNIETLVILFIYKLTESDNIKLSIKLLPKNTANSLIKVFTTNISFKFVSSVPEITSYCKWPIIVRSNHVIAGVCSVARQLVKCSKKPTNKNLLGFRDACLMACAESSIWTRFCEIEMIEIAKNIVESTIESQGILNIPSVISRFEFHMSQPVKMHNIYKIAREHNLNRCIDTKTPLDKLNLKHNFSEGLFMTLADAILYPSFRIFFHKYPFEIVKQYLPLTFTWFNNVDNIFNDLISFDFEPTNNVITDIVVTDFVKESLYIGDTPSHRTEKGVFTKQSDIEHALLIINSSNNEIVNEYFPFGYNTPFTWDSIPLEANPNGGALPQKRANRKAEQLENLAKAVGCLAVDKKTKIVDFCSGSGHLGILLAVYLPNSEVILVENKERSLERAQERILSMNLTNVSIVQSNLDYFQGDFDIGVALHACGVATDLVMKTCIKKKANFVLCPCCYGGIKNCHEVTYPLSKNFQKLNLSDKTYFILAHAADQTHDNINVKTKQGFLCMDIIDTDRKLYAESLGYKVNLGKLQPTSCTNKNNLLVGIFSNKLCSDTVLL